MNGLKEKITKEIIENYSEKHISFVDQPFSKNHLFCICKNDYEFAEYSKFIDVYIYPPFNATTINVVS